MSRILIADNSSDVLDVMGILLKIYGHEIKTAINKKSLLAQIRISVPDLIILDTFLEGGKGKEICKEIRSNVNTTNIPIILMSTNEKQLNDYNECGAVDILPKPFDGSELKRIINSALNVGNEAA